MFNFLHAYQPDPILLSFGFIQIRWYGFLIAIALLVCLSIGKNLAKQKKIDSEKIYDLALWLVIGGILGARLYEVFFIDWNYYAANLSAIVKIWQGGLAIHGAIIGGGLALFWWTKKNRESFLGLADLIAVILPLGQAIGRWGNYFNGELFGRPTNSVIGVPIKEMNRPNGFENYDYFQPTFLYESILNLFLFLILFLIFKKARVQQGTVALLYLIGYAVIRFSTEFIRIDQTPVYFNLRLPQIVSLAIFILAMAVLIKRNRTDSADTLGE